ncbi:MAG TPA: Asp-tRNA(Asn)/Glu-tRNA(Gln) amidotransferase subunit GatC [Candidatus Omnitrophica bacterium]|nr:Asp-tRNA(Asn)/Glu-tRNA(Gln) amidotransferase subunit GatC [Candidatus Omnitrophota bacterium]
MSISREDVKYTANLARLELKDKELDILSKHLQDILDFIDKLKSVDIKEVAPTSHVLPIKNVYREDEVSRSLKTSDALKNAPSKDERFFKVPKVIE